MTSQLQTVSKPPTKTWDDYYKECLERFGGNRGDPKESEAFREGVLVVFVLLHAEFPTLVRCKAATELLQMLKHARDEICQAQYRDATFRDPTILLAIDAVIATAEGGTP